MSPSSASAGGVSRNGASRSSSAPGYSERAVDRLLVSRRRQRLQRVDVGRRAGRPYQRGAEVPGLGNDELHGHALDRQPDGAPLPPARSARRSAVARRNARGPRTDPPAVQTTLSASQASRQRRGSPAASPPSACAMPFTSSTRLREQESPRLGLARERLEHLRLGLRPDAAHRAQPPFRHRVAELVRRTRAERPRDLDRAPGPQAEIATQADDCRARAPARARPARRCLRSRPARAAGSRSRVRSRATAAPGPCAPGPPPASAQRGSFPRPAGRRGRCTDLPRRAPAARRTPPFGRRSRRCP